tara:strand:+ start:22306 stop:23082 length:777 start_codon:yes stop_codon:yes gene_type:complete
MFFIFTEYFKFLRRSTNQHGVHSPFVYDFVTKCLYSKVNSVDKVFFRKFKKRLLESKEEIVVKDLGAGSRVFKGNMRSVSQIVKVASIKQKYGLLLMRLIPYLKISSSLEIGTSLGVASSCMGFADSTAKVITLEGCENTAHVAKEQFDFFNLKNIEVVVGEFDTTLPENTNNNSFDLIFFDGNHTKEATLKYFRESLASKHNDSVFVFDDIHWNSEMFEAWQEIKKHKEVTVTIDTFQWGIVFFREEQKKEHFTIRI